MEKYYIARSRDTNQNALQHWKYIRKEKNNGKWKYYYDTAKKSAKNAIGIGLKDEMDKYQRQSENAAMLRDVSLKAKKAAFDKYEEAYQTVRELESSSDRLVNPILYSKDYKRKSAKIEHYEYLGKKFCESSVKYSDKVVKSNEKYRATKKIYDKSLIGVIDKAVKWFKGLFK